MRESLPAYRCPACGTTLRDNAPEGLCPKCLLVGAAAFTDTGIGRERPPAPPLDAVAAAFPQLEILELVGQGGMGCVFRARQPQLNRYVALKILQESLARDAAFASRFAREAQALASLSHPNIVTIHDFGQSNGLFYLLMEFVDGVNLRQALQAGRFTPEQALAVVPPICDALQYAHDRGIVHRDIKPENLLLDKTGHIKIADFGIAKIVAAELAAPESSGDAAGLGHTAAGTPQYMAPEQRKDTHRADHRADIYSLGVVLYELLTGELPGTNLQPPSHKVQVDVRLDEIVLRALEKDPELRYATAREFKTSIQTVASPGIAAEPPLVAPTFSARHFSYGALALFLAGTLGVLLLMTISPRHELALMFGALGLLLALTFGLMGWRERLGKVVTIATLTVMLGVGITVVVLTETIPWFSEKRRRAAIEEARQIAAEKAAAVARAIAEREERRRNDASATEAKAGSKPERFEPRAGMAHETSWTVHNQPSAINPNGWAVMARMTLGGEAPLRLAGQTSALFRMTLIEGNDDQITLAIREPASPTITLDLRRDRPVEFALGGGNYRILYPSSNVTQDQPDTSPFALVVVTPVDQELPAASADAHHRAEDRPTNGQTTSHFGPVQEITLKTNEFLSLEEGKVQRSKPEHGSVRLIHENGQLLVEIAEMHAFRMEKARGIEQWNTKSAPGLVQDYQQSGFALLPSERFSQAPIESGELPLTFLLPGTGFLQVIEVNPESSAVKLRYKWVARGTP